MFYIYPEKETRMKDTWGYHLLLDCTNGDKELISSKENVYKFIKELVVAINQRGWLGVLVHEFAHMTQWLDNCKAWKDSMNHPDDVDDWLNGKELKNIKRTIAVTRNLELDNEKRSVKLMKQWDLPIDIKDYTQKANAYIQFYNWLYFTRRWCSPENSPYKNPKVYKEMPTVFRMNYRKMSDKYIKIFEEAGI